MICTFFGKPGSGKTTVATALILRAIAHKPITIGHLWGKYYLGHNKYYDKVYSNFACPGAYELDMSQLGKVSFANSLLIIDEAVLDLDCRDFKSFSFAYKIFFSQHRHQHCDVFVFTQNPDDLDKKVRGYTEMYFYISKSVCGFTKVTPIPLDDPDIGKTIDFRFYKAPFISCNYFLRKKYYRYFDSFAMAPLPDNNAKLWDYIPPEKLTFSDFMHIKVSAFCKHIRAFFSPNASDDTSSAAATGTADQTEDTSSAAATGTGTADQTEDTSSAAATGTADQTEDTSSTASRRIPPIPK